MSNAKFPYLSTEDVAAFPSIKNGIDPEKELSYRQQASAFIQELGHRLQCTQCTMNTAIVYMHRFYYLNSFTKFHRNTMAPACLFLACKVEEQPRKVEHIIKAVHRILWREKPVLETNTEEYLQKAEELVVNENILLQTLGFRIIVDHPHPHIVRYCDRYLANSGQGHHIAQVAWFLATNSLHLTTFCLQYPPTIIAALCIYLSCKYISCPPQSKSNQPWWYDIDPSADEDLLTKLAYEFVAIMDKAPTKYKTIKGSKIGSETLLGQGASSAGGALSANDDSTSRQRAPDAVKTEPRDKVNNNEERNIEKNKEGTQSQNNTDEDDLTSPPRKLSKIGTAISLKDYKARKATMAQQGGQLVTQAGESPSLEHKPAGHKTASPTIASSGAELPKSNQVPPSLQDLPPLEPLTLSSTLESHNRPSSREEKLKVEGERHRSSNHHHKHRGSHPKHSGEGSGGKPHHPSGDRHHRHHSHHRGSHRRPSGEKKNSSTELSAQNREGHHHHHHRTHKSTHRHPETDQSSNSGTANGGQKSVIDPAIPKVSMEDPMIDARQILLATPPSPTSAQQQDIVEAVRTEQLNPNADQAVV